MVSIFITPGRLRAEAYVKNIKKKLQVRAAFGSCVAQKCVRLGRETHFEANMFLNRSGPDRFWKLCRWEEPRKGEKTRRHEMTWGHRRGDVRRWKTLRRHDTNEMRWDEMGWDDTDYGDNGMQWAISKRSCDAMRSGEMREDPTLKRDGTRMKSQEIVAAKHRRLACTL